MSFFPPANLRQFSLFKLMFTVNPHAPTPLIHLHDSGARGGLVVRETIPALIYQHPCRSVLDQDTAAGELVLAAPVCSPLCFNANMQPSEEKAKQRYSCQGTKIFFFSPSLKLLSWLVSPLAVWASRPQRHHDGIF